MCRNRSSRALEYILNGVQREFLESSQKTQSSCPPWNSLDGAHTTSWPTFDAFVFGRY